MPRRAADKGPGFRRKRRPTYRFTIKIDRKGMSLMLYIESARMRGDRINMAVPRQAAAVLPVSMRANRKKKMQPAKNNRKVYRWRI